MIGRAAIGRQQRDHDSSRDTLIDAIRACGDRTQRVPARGQARTSPPVPLHTFWKRRSDLDAQGARHTAVAVIALRDNTYQRRQRRATGVLQRRRGRLTLLRVTVGEAATSQGIQVLQPCFTEAASRPRLCTTSAKIVSSSAPGTPCAVLAGIIMPARQRSDRSSSAVRGSSWFRMAASVEQGGKALFDAPG
jgi:hypothetical protein